MITEIVWDGFMVIGVMFWVTLLAIVLTKALVDSIWKWVKEKTKKK